MKWQDRVTVQKGDFAEAIVDRFLESKGFIVYHPKTNGAHAFDRLAIRGKQEVVIAECKAKAMRNRYPDTGIDIRHYNDYLLIQDKHKINVFIFFIDESIAKIYGGFINELSHEREIIVHGRVVKYPLKQNGIIYFPIVAMREIQSLTGEQVTFLKSKSQRSYDYDTKQIEQQYSKFLT